MAKYPKKPVSISTINDYPVEYIQGVQKALGCKDFVISSEWLFTQRLMAKHFYYGNTEYGRFDDVLVMPYHDDGVDILAYQGKTTYLFQCKGGKVSRKNAFEPLKYINKHNLTGDVVVVLVSYEQLAQRTRNDAIAAFKELGFEFRNKPLVMKALLREEEERLMQKKSA